MTKIGVLIPTRGDREVFLNFALRQIGRQTIAPDEIEVVSDRPLSDKPDITYRYRIGCDRLIKKGCDFIVFWEDDDWYSSNYIETMFENWVVNARPDIIGLNHTVYYNIRTRKYFKSVHPRHASMMSTCISAEGVRFTQWGDDNYKFTDTIIWKQLKGYLFSVDKEICVGIKHGIGLCGGVGHRSNWKEYINSDPDFNTLKGMVDDRAYDFYTNYQWK